MKIKKINFLFVGVLIGIAALVILFIHYSNNGNTGTETSVESVHDSHDHESNHDGSEHEADSDHEDKNSESHDDEINDKNVIYMDDVEIEKYEIEVAKAGPGQLQNYIKVSGEVLINPDRLSHIVPYVSGIVLRVMKKLGDTVREGEVMAYLESRELSDLKLSFLVAKERFNLAKTTCQREERLWEQKISSERECLEAKHKMVEARIELEAAEQKLHALGFDDQSLSELSFRPEKTLTGYEIVSPFDGVVIEKHISLGEAIKDDTNVFVIADLSSVWVNLSVHQKDLLKVKIGQTVIISTQDKHVTTSGIISYISPILQHDTRAATARIEIQNPDSKWRPGLFVIGQISVGNINVPLLIPKTALQSLEGKSVVFVETDDGYEAQTVSIGRSDKAHIEILAGLNPGQRYVSKGGFELKANIVTSGLGSHAGHGH